VFVVLLVVFSISFTMMTVQYVARNTQWKDLAEDYREKALVATTHMRNTMAVGMAEKEVLQDKIGAQNETLADQRQALDAGQQARAGLELQLAEAQHGLSSSQARETTLTQQLALEKKRGDLNEQQKVELQGQAIDFQKRNTDLNGRVNELTTTVALLRQQIRGLQQQNYAIRDDNEKLRARLKTAGVPDIEEGLVGKPADKVERVEPMVGGAIRGAIASVKGDIASVNVGAADGVRSGMVFVISRKNEYVGTLKISDVRPDEAGGRLTMDPGRQVQRGDNVIDEVGLVRGL